MPESRPLLPVSFLAGKGLRLKILLVGDIHFRSKKLADIAGAWRRLMDCAYSKGVSLVAQAGDVFDHPNVYGREADMGTIYNEFLAPYDSGNPIKTIIVPGNHDMGGPADLDALSPIDRYPWVNVVRRPALIDNIVDGISICAIPWINRAHLFAKLRSKGSGPDETNVKIDQAINGIVPRLSIEVKRAKALGQTVIMIGHVEVTGAKLNGGQTQAHGLFEFSPVSLAGLGADAYGLAHIHVRQAIAGLPGQNDGYLGTICQLSFGEEGNKCGARLLEVEGGKIVGDTFIDDVESPRYFTVEALDGLEYRSGTDYVKVRGDIRPEDLPEGIIFERRPPPPNARTRTSDVLTADTSMDDLLKSWHELSHCTVDLASLTTMARQVASQTTAPAASIGSLERIDKIVLKNITCHKETTIDLASIEGLCGIEGPSGSGKTTAIESVLVALYGIAPSWTSLPSFLSMGCNDKAVVEVHFQSQGKYFIGRREFQGGKAFSHDAYIFEVNGSDHEAKAGPKVGDVQKWALVNVGDPTLVLAGIFSTQGESGNMIEKKPSERKDLFAKLLWTDKFITISDSAKRQASGDNATIDVLAQKLERLKLELAQQVTDGEALGTLCHDTETLKATLAKLREDLDNAKSILNGLATEKKSKQVAEAKIAEIIAKREAVKKQAQEGKAKKAELSKLDPQPIEAKLAKAKAAVTALDALKSSIQDRIAKSKAMTADADKLKASAALKLSEIGTKYATMLSEFSRKETAFRQQRQDELRLLLDRKAETKTKFDMAVGNISTAKKKISMLGDFPNKDICRSCPLAKDGIEGRNSLPSLEAAAKDLQAAITAMESDVAEHEDETSRRVAAVRKAIPESDSFMPKDREAAAITVATADEMAKAAEAMGITEEEKSLGRSLKMEADKITPTEAELASANGASIEIAKIDSAMQLLRDQFLALDAEAKAIVIPPDRDDSSIAALAKNLEEEVSTSTATLEANHVEIGKRKAQMDAYAAKAKEAAMIESEMRTISQKTDVLNALVAAFGRDGIPQLIVDSNIPRFQDIMSDLMSKCNGRWSIQVSSQKTTKSGSVQEVIDILVDDGRGERDISTYSGGERKLLKSIIRIAFATIQAERTGKGIKILVLDEAMDAMDSDLSCNFIRMLSGLSSSFKQVFVISHKDHILDSLPNCLSFARLPGQPTSVTVRGGNK